MSPTTSYSVPMQKKYQRTYIREWRKHRGLTLEQLADKAGITSSALSMLERGLRGYTQEGLEKLAKNLGADPAALLSKDPGHDDTFNDLWGKLDAKNRKRLIEIAKVLDKDT